MSYTPISVRGALEKLNAVNNGWFLPQVQRQYVWGARNESESFVLMLLDSLLKRYPIGGIVLWDTTLAVPHREFIRDYEPGKFARMVDQGRWGAPKALVYDGQQRLQTLYSVLYFRFNGRVLHFDLLFDSTKAESDETGFLFRDPGAAKDARYIRMTELIGKSDTAREKIAVQQQALVAADGDIERSVLVLENLTDLWDVFVATGVGSIAYFAVTANTEEAVNEVFRRLNTGGIQLTQLELVLSKIKAIQPDYEEKLWGLSADIEKRSGGIRWASAEILRFIHLLVKGTVRIDADRVKAEDIPKFVRALNDDVEALKELFGEFLYGLFKINHASIVPRWLAILPIASFLVHRKRSQHECRIKAMSSSEIALINQYFLLSQFCDWNTQTMVDAFSRLAAEQGAVNGPFPLDSVRQIAVNKNRTGDLHYHQFLASPWLALKVLTPNRGYVFHDERPQVDHIFPLSLSGKDGVYRRLVDVLWNFQPMPAGVNNYKRARHPKEFFSSQDGIKYFGDYDFLPPIGAKAWDDPGAFVWRRHLYMRRELRKRYGVKLIRLRSR